MLPFIASAALAVAAAFLQLTDITLIGNANVNFVLATVIVLGTVHEEWMKRWILILISVFILKFSPIINWFDIVLIATLFLAIIIVDYLPWRKFINVSVAIIIGTVILNIESFSLDSFILEVFLNILTAFLVFWLLKLTYAEKIKKQENRFW